LLATANFIVIVSNTIGYGTQSGIHLLLWPFAVVFAVNMKVKLSAARNVFLISVFTFSILQYFAPLQTTNTFIPCSFYLMLLCSGMLLIVTMSSLHTSLSRRRKKLEKLANRDGLTQLFNRRFFTSFLNYQMAVSLREKRSFTLAMADIDHFKSINDTHGHDVGDKVLKAVAECFDTYLAHHDVACRWGGEEFLIYLPESKVEHAESVIEAISSVIRDQEFDGLSITLSFGLIESDGNESLDELLKRVDALLYQAKAMGRDNVQTKLVP
jgi:diguanylate cyclase (GGDEF)-like protein